jgi:menaquinol-cytochrome c reductase iron-sulfur subunit
MSSEESEVSTRRYSPSRRRFLEMISYLLGALAAGLVAIPIVGAYLSPLLAAPPGQWRRVGKVSDFPVGNFVEATFLNASPVPWSGVTARQAVWLRREPNDHFLALTIYCQHLGCPVRWEPGSKLFLCPCHGGVYYASGKVAAGPPERALPRYRTRVRNGQVEIFTAEIPYP